MGKQLVVIAGLERGRILSLDEMDALQLGCSQNLDVEMRFRDPNVARVHCEVQVNGDRVEVIDSNTPFGTFVNGKRIVKEEIRPGDVIRIGNTELRYVFEHAAETTATGSPAASSLKLPPPVVPVDLLAKLVGKVLGHFRIELVLGTGHWGRVFRARDIRADHVVALKVLKPEFSQSDSALKHLGSALKTVLPLRHPNLLAHLGAGRAGPLCWIATEYIEGKSLTAIIRRVQTTEAFDWRQACRSAVSLARALVAVHQHLVHGQITPQNILIRNRDRQPVLGDLLLARTLQDLPSEQTAPSTLPLEQVHYMAPEQTLGPGKLDGRSDLYSLGAVTYALLTGQPPFEGVCLADALFKIHEAEPMPPRHTDSAIPAALEDVVLQLLAKRPQDRIQSAAKLVSVLEPIVQA